MPYRAYIRKPRTSYCLRSFYYIEKEFILCNKKRSVRMHTAAQEVDAVVRPPQVSAGCALWQNDIMSMKTFFLFEIILKERIIMSTQSNAAMKQRPRIEIRTIAQIGMLAAIATVLMLFEIPLPFAPTFYQIDFSEVPVLVGSFVMGPLAGAIIELVKILIHVVIKGSPTAGVGDIANVLIGCAFCVPAGLIYRRKRTRKSAIIGMSVGTVFMTVLGCFLNAFVLLPAYATAFQMPIDGLVQMGTAVNGHITSLFTLVAFAVAPFNLLKGVLVSVIVFLIYKKISPIFRMR